MEPGWRRRCCPCGGGPALKGTYSNRNDESARRGACSFQFYRNKTMMLQVIRAGCQARARVALGYVKGPLISGETYTNRGLLSCQKSSAFLTESAHACRKTGSKRTNKKNRRKRSQKRSTAKRSNMYFVTDLKPPYDPRSSASQLLSR